MQLKACTTLKVWSLLPLLIEIYQVKESGADVTEYEQYSFVLIALHNFKNS